MVRDWSRYTGHDGDNGDIIENMLYMNLDHIVLDIFNRLDSTSLEAAAKTAKTWREFIDDHIWCEKSIIRRWSSRIPQPIVLPCHDTVQCIDVVDQWLVCGLQNGEAQLWSLLTLSLQEVVADHGSPVTATAIASLSDDVEGLDKIILTGSWRGEVRLWSIKAKSPLAPIRLHRSWVTSISICGCVAIVTSVVPVTSQDGVVTVLDLSSTGATVRRAMRAGVGLSCSHLMGGKAVAGGGMGKDGWCKVWRVLGKGYCSRELFRRQDGVNILSWRVPGGRVSSVKQLQSPDLVAVGDVEGSVWLYKCDQLMSRHTPHHSPITSISLDRDLLVLSSYSGSVAWSMDHLGQINEVQHFVSPAPFTAVVHHKTRLVASTADGTILVYDFLTIKGRSKGRFSFEEDGAGMELMIGCRWCGGKDDSSLHFFLQCPALARPRHHMLQSLEGAVPGLRLLSGPRQLEILLYGDEDVDKSLAIRDAVQQFVVQARC